MDFGTISIFGLNIKLYSLMILIAICIGFLLAYRESKRKGYDFNKIFDMGFYCVLFGIVGARLYFCLFDPYYYKYPLEIFAVWKGGLAIHGGILAALITLIIYCKKNDLKVFDMTDLVVPSLILGQAIGRWGNFFNKEVFGLETSAENLRSLKIIPEFVINGMYKDGVYHQPLFYYESIWCLIGFLVLIILRKIFKELKSGQLTCIYLMWYGVARFFLESLREEEFILKLGNFRIAQIVSVLFVLSGFIGFVVLFFMNVIKKEESK